MNDDKQSYDAIGEHLYNKFQQIKLKFGICDHEYKKIKTLEINRLNFKGKDLPEDLDSEWSQPATVIIFKCKHCKKIKETHMIKIKH